MRFVHPIKLAHILNALMAIAAIALSAGCTSVKTVSNMQGMGEYFVYEALFDEVWSAVPEVVTNVGLRRVSVNNDRHMVLAKHGMTATSWGENVAVFVTKVDPGKTRVEVVTMRKLENNVTAQDWAGPIFIELHKRFKLADISSQPN